MEDADAREGIRLLTQIHETQVANLEVQRKLLELVAAQGARNDEASKRFIERSTVLQDRTMDMLVFNRRVLSFAARSQDAAA